jgi:hypothetical protein
VVRVRRRGHAMWVSSGEPYTSPISGEVTLDYNNADQFEERVCAIVTHAQWRSAMARMARERVVKHRDAAASVY